MVGYVISGLRRAARRLFHNGSRMPNFPVDQRLAEERNHSLNIEII